MGGFVVASCAEIEQGEEILSYQPILGWKGLLAMESQNHQIEKIHSNFEYILLNSVCR